MGDSFFSRAGVDMKFELGKLSYPIMLSISLTDRCNMACSFCAVGCSKDSAPRQQDMDKYMCMKIMKEAKKNCVQEIVFSGGEPLLYNHLDLLEILDYGNKMSMSMSLITNASLLNPEIIDKLSLYIKKINISLHGSEMMHNKITGTSFYSKVIQMIDYINEHTDIEVSLLYTLTKMNNSLVELENVMNISRRYNMPLYISRGNDVGTCKNNNIYPSIEDVNKFARRMIEYGKEGHFIQFANCVPRCILNDDLKSLSKACSSGTGYCSIDSSGGIKTCSQSYDIIGEFKNEKDLKKTWTSTACTNYRKLENLNPICKSCENIISCKGGCKLEKNEKYCIDKMLIEKVNSVWTSQENKYAKLKAKMIKENDDSLLIYTCPAIKCSKNYLEILRLLLNKDGIKISELSKYNNDLISEFEIKMFIYYLVQNSALYYLER